MLHGAIERGCPDGTCSAAQLAALLFRGHAGTLLAQPGGDADALLELLVALLEVPQCPPAAACAALEAVAAACEGSARLAGQPPVPQRAATAAAAFLFPGQASGAAALAGLDASPGSDGGAFGGAGGEEDGWGCEPREVQEGRERSERDAFKASVGGGLTLLAGTLPTTVAAGVLLPAARWGLGCQEGGEDRDSALRVLTIVAGEMGGGDIGDDGQPRAEVFPREAMAEVVGFALAEAERHGAPATAFSVLPPALSAVVGSGAAESPAICERAAEACAAAVVRNGFVGPVADAAAAACAMATGLLSEESLERAAAGPGLSEVLRDPARAVVAGAGENAAATPGGLSPGITLVTALVLAALLPARRPVRTPGVPFDKAAAEAAASGRAGQVLSKCLAPLSPTLEMLVGGGPAADADHPGMRGGVAASEGALSLLTALLCSTAGEPAIVRRALAAAGAAGAARSGAEALSHLAQRPQFDGLSSAVTRMLGAILEPGDCPDGPALAEALVQVAGSGAVRPGVRGAAASAALAGLRGAALRPGRVALPLAQLALAASSAPWACEALPAVLQPAACALSLDAARCRSRDLVSPQALQAVAVALGRAASLLSEPFRAGVGEARKLLGSLEALFRQTGGLVQRPELVRAVEALGVALVDCAVRELSPGTEDELAAVLWVSVGQRGGLEALLADYAERRLGVAWARLRDGLGTHLVGSAQGQATCREALFLFANEAACVCAEGRAA